MFKSCLFCLTSLLLFQVFSLEQNDRSSIERIIQDYTDSWNLRGCVGFGDHYSDSADFVNIYGMKFTGKAEIENRHTIILKSFLKGSKLETVNTLMREVQPGLVVATVFWRCHGFRNPASDLNSIGEIREGVFTHILIRMNEKWEITASQNTLKAK